MLPTRLRWDLYDSRTLCWNGFRGERFDFFSLEKNGRGRTTHSPAEILALRVQIHWLLGLKWTTALTWSFTFHVSMIYLKHTGKFLSEEVQFCPPWTDLSVLEVDITQVHPQVLLFKKLITYLKVKVNRKRSRWRKRESERRNSVTLFYLAAAMARTELGRSQEPRASSRCPMQTAKE